MYTHRCYRHTDNIFHVVQSRICIETSNHRCFLFDVRVSKDDVQASLDAMKQNPLVLKRGRWQHRRSRSGGASLGSVHVGHGRASEWLACLLTSPRTSTATTADKRASDAPFVGASTRLFLSVLVAKGDRTSY